MQLRHNITWSFVVFGVLFTVVRVLVVLLWSLVGDHAVHENVWMELGLSVLSMLILTSAAGAAATFYVKRLSQEFRYDNIVMATTTFAVSTLALLLFAAVAPGEFVDGRPADWITVLTSHLVAVGTFTIAITLATFLAVVALQRQHKRTRLYLGIQTLCVLGIWLATLLLEVGEAFEAISIVLTIIGGFVTLLNIRRLSWLGTIPLEKKVRLLWLCTCGAFAAVVLAVLLAVNTESYVSVSSQMFLRSGICVPAVINLYGFLFFIRMILATLASLPNSGIVDRRSDEVQALSGLTRLVAQSASVDALLESVSQYALSVCRGHGAWCELYDGKQVRIVGEQLVTPEYITHLHNETSLGATLRSAKQPLHVDALTEQHVNTHGVVLIKSLIAIPLITAGVHTGTLVMFSTVEYGFDQDDVLLLSAFADTISVGLEQARLQESSAEKERLQREFEVARSIQISLLPRTAPTTDWEIDAVMIPAAKVGGDYYDFFSFGNGRSGVIIADVSGKGIPAALYMATLKGVVLAESRNATGPAHLLRLINSALYRTMERRTYISIAVVEFDSDTMILRIARAGHTPTLVRTAASVKTVNPPGIAIGLLPSAQFDGLLSEEQVAVAPGDLCLLTTDGVTERRNENMDELSLDPLVTMLGSSSASHATELVQQALSLVEIHADGTEPHDDITIVAVRIPRLGNVESVDDVPTRIEEVAA
ncbi:MAG: SpoIIE family protein phosphatase [Bradyrhizobiaceae bacterium]|nr:SpoIIE family protein phosphatase [Bradyrhizobiaceae bacterium]